MEKFDEYWPLMKNQNDDLYFELIALLTTSTTSNVIESLKNQLSDTTRQYLTQELRQNPYPTCQILKLCPTAISEPIFATAIDALLDDIIEKEFNEHIYFKFLNLLANIDYEIPQLYLRKTQLLVRNNVFRNEFWLSLMSAENSSNLTLVLEGEYQKRHEQFSKRSIFLSATKDKKHFIENMVVDKIDCANLSGDISEQITNIITIIQIINAMEQSKYNSVAVTKLKKINLQSSKEATSLQRLLFLELKRLYKLYDLINYHIPNIQLSQLTKQFNIVDLIVGHLGSLSKIEYEKLKVILLENERSNLDIEKMLPKASFDGASSDLRDKPSELELFEQFSAIKLLLDIILWQSQFSNSTFDDETAIKKLKELQKLMRNIQSFPLFVQTLEIAFSMVFLRWNYSSGGVNTDLFNGDIDPTIESNDESSMNTTTNTVATDQKMHLKKHEQFGFICQMDILENILKTLNLIAIHKKHSEEFAGASDLHKELFSQIYANISEAMWRLSLFKSKSHIFEDNQLQQKSQLPQIDFKKFIIDHTPPQSLASSIQKTSSDDEPTTTTDKKKDQPKSSAANESRRKPRRKHPFRKSDGEKSISFSHSTENEQRKNAEFGTPMLSQSISNMDKKCIVSKMLGTVEHLLTVCLSKGDLETTRKIIKANNLEKSPLANELAFTENFNQIKQKLRDIFEKYEKEEIVVVENVDSSANRPIDAVDGLKNLTTFESKTVEKIKQIAAVGFEASKITNIMATFATENQIQQSQYDEDSISTLLNKYQSNYPYLRFYNGKILQGTIIFDFVLSLANNYEICFNIFTMLQKIWDKNGELSGIDDSIGYFGLFKKIVECLNLYRTIPEEQFGVQQTFYDECFPFAPTELAVKLKRENIYKNLCLIADTELNTLDKLKRVRKQFTELNKNDNYFHRIFHFIVNLTRLLQFRENPHNKSPTEILTVDVTQLIGEIVFKYAVVPLEIETIVCNMNVNLVYTIASSAIPKIHFKSKNLQEQHEQLVELSENLLNDNQNLSTPSSSPFKTQFYDVKNINILNYIKRHNLLVAYLIKEIQQLPGDDDMLVVDELTIHSFSTNYLRNLQNLNETKSIAAVLFGNNLMMAALNFDQIMVNEIEEFLLNTKDYGSALKLIQFAKEIHLKTHPQQLLIIKDWIVCKLLSMQENDNSCVADAIRNCEFIEQMDDIHLKSELLIKYIYKIQSNTLARHLIQTILLHSNAKVRLRPAIRLELEKLLKDICIYGEIATKLDRPQTWLDALSTTKTNPIHILKILLENQEYSLCLRWSQNQPIHCSEKCDKFFTIFKSFLQQDNCTSAEVREKLFNIIENCLSKTKVLYLYDNLLWIIRNLNVLEYIIEYLLNNSADKLKYRKYQMSLKIFQHIGIVPHDSLWNLISKPMLIIEQFLMNARFENISIILVKIRPFLSDTNCSQCHSHYGSSMYDFKSSSDPNFDSSKGFASSSSCDSNEMGFSERFRNPENCVSIDCINLLLTIYATKALDFRVSDVESSTIHGSQANDMVSLDSLCGAFIMPKEAPERSHWIRDAEASHCMCCKRSIFTMLTRRHHCRRCGRVVCHTCSTQRLQIPSLYADVMVRVCNDCFKQTEQITNKISKITNNVIASPKPLDDDGTVEWHFSGNTKHDALLRDEFCFEYAPSVSLCLSILSLHSSNRDCAKFLLYHCSKFESLLKPLRRGIPNVHIDYALVTRMLNCLSLAAKVRGGPPECDAVRDHADIISQIVKNGCETLIPMEQPSTASLRTLRDSLILAEQWSLALNVSLKYGFPTNGVMAAWGLASLKAGCFETAREKFIHCMTKITKNDDDLYTVMTALTFESEFDAKTFERLPQIKRPLKSSPILNEIISILESTCRPAQADVMARANLIRDSNTSLTKSIRSRIKHGNVPIHEPALNILHTLSNLRQICQGNYNSLLPETSAMSLSNNQMTKTATSKTSLTTFLKTRSLSRSTADVKKLSSTSRFYDECLFYLTGYGSHNDIVRFLIKHEQVFTALKYCLYQRVDSDIFIYVIFLPFVKRGMADVIISLMVDLDETLVIWREYIIQTCRYLEHKGLYNSLYHLQILLKDPVRASMTCVKFYSMNCSSYRELQSNTFHLLNAQKHLQAELELCQWEEIKVNVRKRSTASIVSSSVVEDTDQSLLMKMDSRTLNSHINTIWRQMEVTKFLAKCENDGRETVELLPKICIETINNIPTLFGSIQNKIQLAVLTLLCGTNIEEGFGLAYRIIQDFNLKSIKVYGFTAKYLSAHNRFENVEKLIDCIKSNDGGRDETAYCNEIISLAIETAVSACAGICAPNLKLQINSLIKQIDNVIIQINCHILSNQLISAYLLAVQSGRLNDVKRVLRKAEETNQLHVKKLCERKLNVIENSN